MTTDKKTHDPYKSFHKRFAKVERSTLFPKTLSSALQHSIKKPITKRGFSKHDMIRNWNNIVGDELAKYCQPIKLVLPRNDKGIGTLYVKTNSAFAAEIQYNEPLILERMMIYYGYRVAGRIVIMQ